ncbi:hypothetical protein ACHAWX_003241 [Stephanocyclus meneghinianus]
MEKSHLKLLPWMWSKLAMHVDMPNLEDLDLISLHLVKIPEDYGVGGDKVFQVLKDTLPGMLSSKKECLSKEQIDAEIPITTVCGDSETVFK